MRQKNWYNISLALILVLAVGVSLWFAAPASALTVDITEPSPTRLGSTIFFDVTVSIEDTELLPIQRIDLDIYHSSYPSTYRASCTNLPLTSDSKSYTSAETGRGAVDIEATADTGWRHGYGYGYATWEGTAYHFGYRYGYGPGPTSITYNITWYSPGSWISGDYTIETKITADTMTFTKTKSVRLS